MYFYLIVVLLSWLDHLKSLLQIMLGNGSNPMLLFCTQKLTCTGLRTAFLLPWTVISGFLMSTLTWMRLASSSATTSLPLKARDQVSWERNNQTTIRTITTCFNCELLLCRCMNLIDFRRILFHLTSLFQPSNGICRVTLKKRLNTFLSKQKKLIFFIILNSIDIRGLPGWTQGHIECALGWVALVQQDTSLYNSASFLRNDLLSSRSARSYNYRAKNIKGFINSHAKQSRINVNLLVVINIYYKTILYSND